MTKAEPAPGHSHHEAPGALRHIKASSTSTLTIGDMTYADCTTPITHQQGHPA